VAEDDLQRFRANRQDEIDSAAQYRAMAEVEPDEGVARIYRELAAVEEKHITFWETQLHARGVDPGPRRPSWRARVLAWTARKHGARMILPTVAQHEAAGRNDYASQNETAHTRMTAQERSHTRMLQSMLKRATGVAGSELARVEGRHRNVGGNALRAAVLGSNDGLCSNLALVMGVAGATASSELILVTGIAGLVAGAFSMALGEWISVTSSRELAERELRVESEELAAAPEEEREELQLIYEAKGVPKDEARQLSGRLLRDQGAALDVLAREELGLDPDELGSPWGAAFSSFTAFAAGALVPLLPFLAGAREAVTATIALSALALFIVGCTLSLFTGRGTLWSGLRMVLIGGTAGTLTWLLGSMLGVGLG
jgi:VIT1/CCC1 family predicted Fe2+/Mn2+ transporter